MYKTSEFWETVLWSDETKLEMSEHMDQWYIWYAKGQAYDQVSIIPLFKHEGGLLMIWGCFSAVVTGKFHHIPGIIDSQEYHAILKENMIPSVDKLNLRDHWTFKQDNNVNQSLVEK